MPDETKTVGGNAAPVDSPSQEAVEDTQAEIVDTTERIRELENRLTNSGRLSTAQKTELAGLKAERETLSGKLTEAVEANNRWHKWYLENYATPQEKATAAARAEAEKARATVGDETAIWKAIAEEEEPAVKKALLKLAKTAEANGERVTKTQIKVLRETFAPDEEEPKEPTKVSGHRNTGGSEKTVDEKIAEAKKAKDTTALMNLLAEKAQAETKARR